MIALVKPDNLLAMPTPQGKSNELQEATALRPFMRQLVSSLGIAYGTSQDNIPGVIRTTFTGYGDNVINMVLCHLISTPIAFTLLCLELFLNIFSSMKTRNSLLTRLAVMMNNSTSIRMRLIIGPLIGAAFCFMLCIIASPPLVKLLCISLAILFSMFFTSCSTFPLTCPIRFSVSVPLYLTLLKIAFLALSKETAIRLRSGIKEICRCRQKLLTWACALLAGYGVLRYDVHMASSNLVIGSEVLAHLLSKTLLPPHYTIKPLPKQLQEVAAWL